VEHCYNSSTEPALPSHVQCHVQIVTKCSIEQRTHLLASGFPAEYRFHKFFKRTAFTGYFL